MIARAKDKGVYDELIKGEVTECLRDHADAYDVIVSADTLVYFGDLEAVLAAAARALRSDGIIVFTLEHDVRASAGDGPRLQFHGRYGHPQAYVERVLAASGLDAAVDHAELRMEAGVPVPGLVVVARRKVRSQDLKFEV
jgi:predicted TPR repeat methyltransferase